MKSFIAFFKKEVLESVRSGKLAILGILFLLFGIMNPAIAKMIPWLLEIMSDYFAEAGMTVTEVTIDALTSWTQFFKNIPMALRERQFMEEYAALLGEKGKDAVIRRENKTKRRKKKAVLDGGKGSE